MLARVSPDAQKIGEAIHIWHASLDGTEEALCHLEPFLSPDEKTRANRFHFARDRNRYVMARGLLRELLGAYLQQVPASLEFSYAEHGKPFLAGGNESNELHFNLSHTGNVALYAFARERNLGIDVEQMRVDAAGEEIARRYFSAREVSALQMLPPHRRVDGFFNCWTRKEAYLKATGMGLHLALDGFSVSLAPGQRAQFLSGVESKWQLAAVPAAEGYAAAVVYDGAPCAILDFCAENCERRETKIG